MTSQVDIGPFVEAAMSACFPFCGLHSADIYHSYEESKLSDPSTAGRMLSKRQIAQISPRLGVLNNIPFSIPFDVRVSIFRSFINNDAANHGYNLRGHRGMWNPPTRVVVRRGKISEDGFNKLDGVDLKGPIAITFIDAWGQEECVLLCYLYAA